MSLPAEQLSEINQRITFLERLNEAQKEGERLIREDVRLAKEKLAAAQEAKAREKRCLRDNWHIETLNDLWTAARAWPIRISVSVCDGMAGKKFREISPSKYKLWMTGSWASPEETDRPRNHMEVFKGNDRSRNYELRAVSSHAGTRVKRFRPLHDEWDGPL